MVRFFKSAFVTLILFGLVIGYWGLYLGHFRPESPVARSAESGNRISDPERLPVDIFERVSPSVVQVVRSSPVNPLIEEESSLSAGTGFVWDQAGHVVTNEHVVQNGGAFAVRFASGDMVQTELVGVAPHYDLAVLKIRNAKTLPRPLVLGRSAELKVGQSAYAIGNPFGLDQSMTSGIISALKRRLPTSAGREIPNVIQTDAAINPGNSGGPLLDSAGRLIGVTTAIISPSGSNAGIGFAIPVDTVNRVVPELIRKGRMPTLGIGIVAASEAISAQVGIEGVIIVRTTPGSPAERAGLRGVDFASNSLGDVVYEVNGKRVRRLSDLTEEIQEVGAGRSVRLSVRRGNQTRMVDAEVIDLGR